LEQQKNVPFIVPVYPPDDGKPSALVWLVHNKDGSDTAYVSAVDRMDLADVNLSNIVPVVGSRNTVIANQYNLEVTDELRRLFPRTPPAKPVAVEWAENLRLIGYQFEPISVGEDETTTLNLNWEILGSTSIPYKMFLQGLNSRGQPFGQIEVDPISRKMYRWRYDGLILEQFPLDFNTELEPGMYFVRLGFFDPKSNQRVSAYTPEKELLGDELIVGPFYVEKEQSVEPQHALRAMLDDSFELLSYTIHPSVNENTTTVELFWQVHKPVDIDYTVFVQLLDTQNQIIAQVDAQPLPGIYPTSRWQTGDIITEKFDLPVHRDVLADENKLVTGMYDLETGMRLPVYNNTGQLLPEGLIYLSD
jgi:hypothetical protein